MPQLNTKAGLFGQMLDELRETLTKHGLDDNPPLADDLEHLLIFHAKDQYKQGNKSGIRFALSDKGKTYFGQYYISKQSYNTTYNNIKA